MSIDSVVGDKVANAMKPAGGDESQDSAVVSGEGRMIASCLSEIDCSLPTNECISLKRSL